MLEVPEGDPLDPNPITPADSWAIYNEAVKQKDDVFAAMMLFALNASMYSSEVGAVRWTDVDLERAEFASRRNKIRMLRVAVWCPEVVDALEKLPRVRETIFNTPRQAYNRMSVHCDWTKYRTDAKVKSGATFSQIRDARFTTACRMSADQARVLSVHRLSGMVAHYVLRRPQFVADACKAIRAAFYGAKAKYLSEFENLVENRLK